MLEFALYGLVRSVLIIVIAIIVFLLIIKFVIKENRIGFWRIFWVVFVSSLLWSFLLWINVYLWIIGLVGSMFLMIRYSLKPDIKKSIIYTVVWFIISVLVTIFLPNLLKPILWVFFPHVVQMQNQMENIFSEMEDLYSQRDGQKNYSIISSAWKYSIGGWEVVDYWKKRRLMF